MGGLNIHTTGCVPAVSSSSAMCGSMTVHRTREFPLLSAGCKEGSPSGFDRTNWASYLNIPLVASTAALDSAKLAVCPNACEIFALLITFSLKNRRGDRSVRGIVSDLSLGN